MFSRLSDADLEKPISATSFSRLLDGLVGRPRVDTHTFVVLTLREASSLFDAIAQDDHPVWITGRDGSRRYLVPEGAQLCTKVAGQPASAASSRVLSSSNRSASFQRHSARPTQPWSAPVSPTPASKQAITTSISCSTSSDPVQNPSEDSSLWNAAVQLLVPVDYDTRNLTHCRAWKSGPRPVFLGCHASEPFVPLRRCVVLHPRSCELLQATCSADVEVCLHRCLFGSAVCSWIWP